MFLSPQEIFFARTTLSQQKIAFLLFPRRNKKNFIHKKPMTFLTVETHIGLPIQSVWEAWTNPEKVKKMELCHTRLVLPQCHE
jgi:hypothetical protein